MGKKRAKSSSNAIGWWSLVVLVAAFLAWLLWQTANPGKSIVSKSPPNSIDISRATNLLHWLGTNFMDRPAPSNVVAAPATSPPPMLVTNVPRTNIVTRPVAPPPPALPPTNLIQTNIVAPVRPGEVRPVRDMVEAQIGLARLGISSGPIDGLVGYQTRSAIRAFQKQNRLPMTGDLDAATRGMLTLIEPVFTTYLITAADLADLQPIPSTWLEKSEADALGYETALEMVAERHQASHGFIRALNPSINWNNVAANTLVKVPNVVRTAPKIRAAFIRIQLSAKTMEAFDSETNLLVHFPCSIAQKVEKRPLGTLYIVKAAENPNYTFDPDVFPESEEARQLGRRLIIPSGPNNPVGVAWISLDKPGYGIHGTPRPDQVGRTESHGCFRLANWNAEYLLKITWAGMPVYIEP
jgi:lipoprotein-anchoring transpeptidase ErfK/SrfK